jgi:hypothetical protein
VSLVTNSGKGRGVMITVRMAEAVLTEVVPMEVVLTEVVPMEVVPTEAVSMEVVPTEAVWRCFLAAVELMPAAAGTTQESARR